ncbi:FGGY-family carbohydrate kinase [Affinibrenneria salicis]|uniref:FGGY-family carbohydrate kinase n=1 Tax=Affinibrenneria salicis TaxID=2590031 RepID=A0A5J5G795_9GAMM|nr:FGGY-family carbohydrate kinase [Affinibrenneria salicis]KAA9002799.1 FGGY-family carbohydrate kinase [Affinibrenneria salicis]KAA9002914.1 FGGY-family carbohydrate kinase [Affinibrenneria salicis]
MHNGGYYLGVDVGSASVRAGLYDARGQRLAFAVRPISQFRHGADQVEQSSAEIWRQVCAAVREAVDGAQVDRQRIRSLGFDATCSLVAIDGDERGVSVAQDGAPDRDIIMWMDHRAAQETAEINASGDDALRYVGGEVSIEMELPKVLWLKRHFPQRYQQTARFFDLADFLVWKATGNDVASLCTLTCKWNYLAHEGRFSMPLLRAVGLDDLLTKIPGRIIDIGAPAGQLSARAAGELGLPPGVVVASGIIDAHAGGLALIGGQPQGALAIISGTSNCHMLVNKAQLETPGVWGPYWSAMLPGWWLTEGGQSAAGSLIDWTLRQQGQSAQLFSAADAQGLHPVALANRWVAQLEQHEPLPTRHLHVLADHHGNRSPRANPHARGSVCGLTLESGEPALARLYLATLQAIAYGTRHIIDAMEQAGHRITHLVMCGGATHNPLWLREYADIAGRDIHLMREEDAVTLGAAICGAVACGAWPDFPAACGALAQPGETLRARPEMAAFHQRKYQVYLQLYEQQQALDRIMADAADGK